MKQIITTTVFLSLLLGSCSKDECTPRPDDQTLTPVTFLPSAESFLQSRAMKTAWAQGDQLAIFSDIAVKKDGTTSTTSITYTRGATEGSWTSPSASEEWYFADAIHQHNFYAYYPTGSATSYTTVEVPDISAPDGTKTLDALKGENDFMRGTAVATKDMLTANLQMYRVFAIINLNVSLKQDAFAGNAATLTDVKLTSANSLPLVNSSSSNKATVDLSNGRVTCTGGLTTVTLHPTAGFTLTPTALAIPVKIFPQQSAINVQFTIGGKTSPALALGSTSNFIGGRVYSYTVQIGADVLPTGIGDPIIFDWTAVNGTPTTPVTPTIPL